MKHKIGDKVIIGLRYPIDEKYFVLVRIEDILPDNTYVLNEVIESGKYLYIGHNKTEQMEADYFEHTGSLYRPANESELSTLEDSQFVIKEKSRRLLTADDYLDWSED
jgi:hypothetical protein